MRALDIRPQPRLSLARTVAITVNGVRYRLFRSLVTVVVVTVAVAFMMNVLSEGVLRHAVVSRTRSRIRDMRMVGKWIGRLTTVPTVDDIILSTACEPPDSGWNAQIARVGGLSAAEAAAFEEVHPIDALFLVVAQCAFKLVA